MAKGKVCLVVVFNHRYEQNIQKLEGYYSPRFSRIRYVVPFAPISHPKAIRVVENGYTFGGHIAQASREYIEQGVSSYAFIADDLILNPRLNEDNLERELGVDSATGYIKSLAPLDPFRYRWHSAVNSTVDLLRAGFNYENELPAASLARSRFERMGFKFFLGKPGIADMLWCIRHARSVPLWAFKLMCMVGRESKYPLLFGYSDFVMVPSAAIHDFVHYCGVFSAMNMFAEVAIPTSLALAVDELRTELVRGEHFDPKTSRHSPVRNADSKLRGVEFWGGEGVPFSERLNHDFKRLIEEFPADCLYYHPVKLSQWH